MRNVLNVHATLCKIQCNATIDCSTTKPRSSMVLFWLTLECHDKIYESMQRVKDVSMVTMHYVTLTTNKLDLNVFPGTRTGVTKEGLWGLQTAFSAIFAPEVKDNKTWVWTCFNLWFFSLEIFVLGLKKIIKNKYMYFWSFWKGTKLKIYICLRRRYTFDFENKMFKVNIRNYSCNHYG